MFWGVFLWLAKQSFGANLKKSVYKQKECTSNSPNGQRPVQSPLEQCSFSRNFTDHGQGFVHGPYYNPADKNLVLGNIGRLGVRLK